MFKNIGEALPPDQSPTLEETWQEMEKVFESGEVLHCLIVQILIVSPLGKVKAIGVSNFSVKTLTKLLQHSRITPMVNQVETHPCLPQIKLLEYCRTNDILVTAYSPIGKHKYANNPALMQIASRKHMSEAQILLSWAVARGTAAIPKSEKMEHLIRNITVSSINISLSHGSQRYHIVGSTDAWGDARVKHAPREAGDA